MIAIRLVEIVSNRTFIQTILSLPGVTSGSRGDSGSNTHRILL